VVTEAFDFPNVGMVDPFSVSDSPGDNDGFPEPGENVLLSIAVNNPTGSTVNNVVVSVTGGGMVNYGNIADGATVTMNVPYTVPGGAMCGSLHEVTITVSSDIGTQAPEMREFRLGVPVGGPPVSFTNATPIDMPNGQPTTTSGPFSPYPSNIMVAGLSGQKVIKLTVNGYHHEFEDDLDFLLVGPGGQKYIFMSDVGGSTELLTPITFSVSDNGADLLPDAAGMVNGVTYRPSNVGANDPFDAPAPGVPYENAAPAGAATFASVFGSDGAAMNGTWSLYGDDDAGSDPGRMDNGWTLTFEANDYACSVGPGGTPESRADFDGDGKTDLSVFRPSEGNWYLNGSTDGFSVLNWGLSDDTLVPGDYDNDGKADTAVYRPDANPANADYYVLNSNGFVFSGVSWGIPGDIAVNGDYDGDGKTDFAVFRPSSGVWYILNSIAGANTVEPFGLTDDVPLAIDNDGDGRTNLAVFRPSNNTWYIAKPTGTPATNFDAYPFGTTGDLPVQADYDGDDKEDVAMFRPSNGTWYIRQSSNGMTSIKPFGQDGDIPVPGDYDGDGTDDVGVYRNGTWYVDRSTDGLLFENFGLSTDIPIPAKYLPAVAGGGGGGEVTVSYTGPAVALPDNSPGGVNINIVVAGAGNVSDLNFRFDTGGTCDGTIGDVDCAVNHTWVGDLIFKLTPPDGSPTVTFFDRPGVPGTTVGCSNNNLGGILLNDEGGFPSVDAQGNPTPAACNSALLFPTGNFSPINPFSVLDGENADGTWVLNVSDNAAADTGSVRRFSLVFNSGN
jgi:subtilisin-like proprotein convertase family protein